MVWALETMAHKGSNVLLLAAIELHPCRPCGMANDYLFSVPALMCNGMITASNYTCQYVINNCTQQIEEQVRFKSCMTLPIVHLEISEAM